MNIEKPYTPEVERLARISQKMVNLLNGINTEDAAVIIANVILQVGRALHEQAGLISVAAFDHYLLAMIEAGRDKDLPGEEFQAYVAAKIKMVLTGNPLKAELYVPPSNQPEH